MSILQRNITCFDVTGAGKARSAPMKNIQRGAVTRPEYERATPSVALYHHRTLASKRERPRQSGSATSELESQDPLDVKPAHVQFDANAPQGRLLHEGNTLTLLSARFRTGSADAYPGSIC